jgi:hypothetical protein
VGIRNRTNDRALIHLLGDSRQAFGNSHPGDRRRNRIEFAPYLGGGIVLGIESVNMGRPAGQVNHDDRLVRGTRTKGFLSFKQLRKGQTRDGTDFKEISSGDSVTGTKKTFVEFRYHVLSFLRYLVKMEIFLSRTRERL